MNNQEIYDHYIAVFRGVGNRFNIVCPDCKQGCNSKGLGGSEYCFHCDVCGLVECEVTSPVLSISGYGEDQ